MMRFFSRNNGRCHRKCCNGNETFQQCCKKRHPVLDRWRRPHLWGVGARSIRFIRVAVVRPLNARRARLASWFERASEPKDIDEFNATTTTTTILTDLNDDCLEHIFLYLTLEDLLNIVHTNKQLKPAADLAFARNFGRGKFVHLKSSNYLCISKTERVQITNPYRLLRCFGHLISKQRIEHHTMLKYVNQYCSESTIEIELYGTIRSYIKKPFRNVETVSSQFHSLNWRFNRLTELFPNVRTLSFHSWTAKPKYFAVNFPYLNQLEIVAAFWSPGRRCRVENCVNMLRLNPQIRNLYLGSHSHHDVTLLRVASQHLQFLEHLHLSYSNYRYMNFEGEFVNFAYLKELKITHCGDIKTKIPISSSCLKAFSFKISSWSHGHMVNVDILLEFLRKHPSITKFSLTPSKLDGKRITQNEKTTIFTNKIIEAMSSMEEIDISLLEISTDDAIKFVKNCKLLKKLCYGADDNAILAHLKTKLGVKWQVMIAKFNESETYNITIVKRHT